MSAEGTQGRGLLIAAPFSGSGKTIVTMALARALRDSGHHVRAAKSGPDYIDPAFHAVATGAPCLTLDAFSMSAERLKTLAAGDGLLLIEGAMGLFDGAPPDGRGSAAVLAGTLGLPFVLVVNAGSIAQSVAPLVDGFVRHDPGLTCAGIILNNVASERHERMLKAALGNADVPILGSLPREASLRLPSRHLGLVQAGETTDLEAVIAQAARHVGAHVDLTAIAAAATRLPPAGKTNPVAPLGTTIAIARDQAFAFCYPHLMGDWQMAGARLLPFSPLADEPPADEADAIYLPGGYPELHALTLARAGRFRAAMTKAAKAGKTIYGECGGYMVLGRSITDARGIAYPMCGLLDLQTSFAKRRLHLGYRRLAPLAGPWHQTMTGHEFHYATTLHATGAPLFAASDAFGDSLGEMGLVSGSVSGSFAHIIDLV